MAWIDRAGKTISWKPAYLINEKSARAIGLALLLVLGAAFSIHEQKPPPEAAASVSPDLFSAGRAIRHLAVIAEKPHPIGSIHHATVRDYLVKELSAEGLHPEIQRTTVVTRKGPPLEIAGVENVLARLEGTAGTKAVLLVSHYDSVANSFGANDDGAAVASMLETLRALRAGPSLKSDVIFLFTDGEENGLLGAQAFADEHLWAKDVGVVFNFEARGNSGPVIMFEVSDDNGWLIRQFGQASPFPVAHSLSYEIYKLLPNNTDLTVFRKAGMPGFNFAYIDGISRYHTPLDNFQEVDRDSLQHQGSYALALTRHFGNLDLPHVKERNAVYFDLFGNVLVHYSTIWVIPLTVFVSALFAVLLVLGFRNQKLTIGGICLGLLSLFVSILVASATALLLWKVVWMLREGPSREASQSRLLLLSFVALAIGITSVVYTLAHKRASVESLTAGTLIWWLLLTTVTSIFLPGATFLFHWPFLFSLIGFGWVIFARKDGKKSSLLDPLILGLFALPGIILFAPTIFHIFVGLTLNWAPLIILMVVLLFGLLVPHLRMIAAPVEWGLPGVSIATGIILLVVGASANRASDYQPPGSIYYALNTDTGKAIWASDATHPDQRTSEFFTGETQKGTLADFNYAKTSRQYTVSSAPVEPLPAPEISLLEDKTENGVRALRVRLFSPRQAGRLSVYLDSEAKVLSTSVKEKVIDDMGQRVASSDPKNQWGLRIDGFPQEGIELRLKIMGSEPLKIRLVDQSYGLPQINRAGFQPNPQSQTMGVKPDLTLLSKSFSL